MDVSKKYSTVSKQISTVETRFAAVKRLYRIFNNRAKSRIFYGTTQCHLMFNCFHVSTFDWTLGVSPRLEEVISIWKPFWVIYRHTLRWWYYLLTSNTCLAAKTSSNTTWTFTYSIMLREILLKGGLIKQIHTHDSHTTISENRETISSKIF